jgi:hypothetical protein
MRIATATRYVYDFAEGSRDMRALLGGLQIRRSQSAIRPTSRGRSSASTS